MFPLLFVFLIFILMLTNPIILGLALFWFILLLPILIFFHSLQILLIVPVSLWQTFTNKRVRINHAIEHATANVLEEKYGVDKVSGLAFKDGFKLMGYLPDSSTLMRASQEALQRLRNGESNLALHPRCGTSIIIGQFLFALMFVIYFLFSHHFSIIEILIGFLLTMTLSTPLGLLAQKFLTTSTDVDGMYLSSISMDRYGQVYFKTNHASVPYVERPIYGGFFRPFFDY